MGYKINKCSSTPFIFGFFFESRPPPFPLLKTEIQKFIVRNRNPERRGEVGKTREKVYPSTCSHPA